MTGRHDLSRNRPRLADAALVLDLYASKLLDWAMSETMPQQLKSGECDPQ